MRRMSLRFLAAVTIAACLPFAAHPQATETLRAENQPVKPFRPDGQPLLRRSFGRYFLPHRDSVGRHLARWRLPGNCPACRAENRTGSTDSHGRRMDLHELKTSREGAPRGLLEIDHDLIEFGVGRHAGHRMAGTKWNAGG